MGFSFWDVMQIVAPVAATAVGGPAAGIAVSGAMGAGTGIAKGEGVKGALLRGAVGAGTGAVAAGATGALSKGAEGAATKAVQKAGMDASMGKILASGLDDAGMPIVSNSAMAASKAASDAAANSAKNKALMKVAELTTKGRGKNEGETAAMLKTVSKGSKVAQQTSALFGPDEEMRRFSQVQGLAGLPGMAPQYQYGRTSYSPSMVSTRRYF
jgi:hypothetical protein